MICFDFLFMRFSQSHDQSCKFSKLIWVKLGLFFNFLSMRLSRSHYSSHVFSGLTWVVSYVLFLIDFFSLILQHWTDGELNFVIYFNFLSIKFFRSYDPSHEFNKLTWVVFLGSFFNWFFFNFILQHWVDWKLGLIICFDLFSIESS